MLLLKQPASTQEQPTLVQTRRELARTMKNVTGPRPGKSVRSCLSWRPILADPSIGRSVSEFDDRVLLRYRSSYTQWLLLSHQNHKTCCAHYHSLPVLGCFIRK